MEKYQVLTGPEAYFCTSAARMGIILPEPGEAHIEGRIVPEDEAMEFAARKFLEAKNPTIHPGPLVLWNWNAKAVKKAKAIKILADAIPARL
ncbi:MAG: carbon monoxide dehydrogenase beta subunit family protein, partial [Nitrospirota bacterium]